MWCLHVGEGRTHLLDSIDSDFRTILQVVGEVSQWSDVDAIFDGDKYYKLNKKNLQYLLKPYHSENEIIEYFEIIYSSKSTKKIYFLEEEKSKYEISYCDFSNIEFGCGNRGDLKFQEITLNEDFKEVEIKNLSKKIKKSEECIIYCFG